MNNSRAVIWYETGSVEEVHLQDPPYEVGACVQREYFDVSDPDKGIFVDRMYIDSGDAIDGEDGYRELTKRIQVISPDNLASAISVEIHGIEVLRRDPSAKADCGLAVTSAGNLGFTEDEKGKTATWRGEALALALDRLHEMGPEGDAEISRRLDAFFSRENEEGRREDGGTAPAGTNPPREVREDLTSFCEPDVSPAGWGDAEGAFDDSL